MIKLDHLTIPVRDREISRDWYVTALGLEVEFEVPAREATAARRYQISERDIPQRLAVYHGTRGGRPFARWREFRHPLGAGKRFP